MRRHSFLGILGLVGLVFGVVTHFLLPETGSVFSLIHFSLGTLFLLWFFFAGGLRLIGKKALRRATGFGVGVTVYSALFVGLLGLLNYFVLQNDPVHYDSTEQKVFTIAPQTKKVLSSLEREVVMRGFFVGGVVDPELDPLIKRIMRQARNLSWKVVDPIKQPQIAEKYGISERGTLHFSFADGESNREVKIVRNIDEQEIVNAILKLTRGGNKKVYWISGHGEANLDEKEQAGFLFLKEAIFGENIRLEKLELSTRRKIPEDASAILLMSPRKALLEFEIEAITSYLDKGGNALLLTEPRTTDDVANIAQRYGIKVGADIVLDEVVKLLEGPTLVVQPMITDYGNHPITKDFAEGIILSTVRSVRAVPNEKFTATEFAFTSNKSWAEKDLEAIFGEPPTAELSEEDDKGPVPVAVASERADSAGRIVVMGDADFVANINIRHLYNRDFFLNSLNWVLGDEENVSIRSTTMRGSTKSISDEQLKRMFLVTAILIPELLLLWGLSVWWFRQ
jgi:ABC-type uncharacterized transport system involved in gliding motility auxiliary subunit